MGLSCLLSCKSKNSSMSCGISNGIKTEFVIPTLNMEVYLIQPDWGKPDQNTCINSDLPNSELLITNLEVEKNKVLLIEIFFSRVQWCLN